MRVIILNGSPRPKGNTSQMIKAFCEGLEEACHEYGVYSVCKMNIHGCLACEYCHGKGKGTCIQQTSTYYGNLLKTMAMSSPASRQMRAANA